MGSRVESAPSVAGWCVALRAEGSPAKCESEREGRFSVWRCARGAWTQAGGRICICSGTHRDRLSWRKEWFRCMLIVPVAWRGACHCLKATELPITFGCGGASPQRPAHPHLPSWICKSSTATWSSSGSRRPIAGTTSAWTTRTMTTLGPRSHSCEYTPLAFSVFISNSC